jgi:CBS domain-containing protein
MGIASMMTTDLPIVAPGDGLREAAQQMKRRNVRALPVCEGDRLVGILTDWDVAKAVADQADPAQRSVADYMSTDLVVSALDAPLIEAAALMADRRIHHLLVCDGDRFVGMVHLDVEWSQLAEGLGPPTATFAAPI